METMKNLTEACLKQVIKPRPKQSHKGNFGKILIIGGNKNMGGAVIMSASAAVHAGAGLVTCATDSSNFFALHARLPEAMVVDHSDFEALTQAIKLADTIVIGPGLGLDHLAKQILRITLTVVRPTATLIIDGSAITLLAQQSEPFYPTCQVIYTPHQAEWARLSGLAIAEQLPQANQSAQQKLAAHVVLKKHHTEIYHRDNTLSRLPIGGPYMATGGMGDTLTGIIAAFMGQFKTFAPAEILDAAVYLHSAVASELSQSKYVVLPTDIIEHLQTFMAQFS